MAKISRRDFFTGVGVGGVGVAAGVAYDQVIRRPMEMLVPQVIPPEDYSPGVATWYNTACTQCSAGCGISVRIREGRAKKIEGNPVHPVNQGRLCALGQSGLNALYNPDRIRSPQQLVGPRGSGQYETISWDEALTKLAVTLGTMKLEEKGDRIFLLTGETRGHLNVLFSQFMSLLGSGNYLQHDFTFPINLRAASKLAFGTDGLPYYDIANADYVLSFGADFLGTWISPVHYSLAYGHFRQGRPDHRGTLIQIEPRMSLTGASADQWLPVRAGGEALLALGIAHAIVTGGGYTGADREDWRRALAAFAPSAVAEGTGVAEDRILALAEAFSASDASLAIGGGATAAGPQAVASLTAVNVLNYLAGNINREGGVILNSAPPFVESADDRQASYQQMLDMSQALAAGKADVLLIHDTNPLFSLPPAAGFREALDKVPTIVALSSFPDETTLQADLILPTDTYLEAWGDDVPALTMGAPLASITQPVVARVFDTRSAGDIVLSLARQTGGELPVAMPWSTAEEFIKASWQKVYEQRVAEGATESFDDFWIAALEAGVWGQAESVRAEPVPNSAAILRSAIGKLSGSSQDESSGYPFALHPYTTLTFLDGRGANLPWQQELPDPLTSIVYNSWVELNPVTAEGLGLREGDVVEVSSSAGSARAPVFIYEGIRPDVVAMPLGQGHADFGRYASGRGANPIQILVPETDADTGALAWAATRVKLAKTGERVSLIKTDGVTRTLGRQILGPEANHG